ncbi:hypothetical protein ISS05_01330 [Candidatus Woesearchaeota archaeon]|nr:hypothetical protein [Candidatus Woesearchaeota archaeon]
MSKQKRLRELEESYESKVIEREEYLKKKKEIEEELEEELKESPEEKKEAKSKGSDKILLIGIGLVILLFVAILFIPRLMKEPPKTIEDWHLLNIQGKLKPEQGYMYKDAYSFINLDGFWYTQLTSPSGKRLYNMALRYSPSDLEDIHVLGYLNTDIFNNATDYYVTFNPAGSDFSHVALAISDFNQHMINVFAKKPIAACDKNETEVCEGRPIITCNNTNKITLYIKEANKSLVKYDGNCVTVEGNGFDLVKGVDRVLYNLYGIMKQ